ncbi:hypothetical protein BT96DRAFT_1100459 [Gymnopus androsaceus JB14]|uniref:Uncharacterized protein n=1 Tax=Gymnopus androsaceus JB14 TaxID=1447944 RepID=A0A6A4HRP6_9AGAR|nr:hypothetical protein BT96DRAFT_1100459 [Gymnopus androsaceus JB14]
MSPPRVTPDWIDSYTAEGNLARIFADLAEEENVDPFGETAKTRQRWEVKKEAYKDAMRLARLEQEEVRVKRAIEEKERQEREEGQAEDGFCDKTPPASEIQDVEMELAAARTLATSRENTKRKRRWDVPEPSDENADPNKTDTGGVGQRKLWKPLRRKNDGLAGTQLLQKRLSRKLQTFQGDLLGSVASMSELKCERLGQNKLLGHPQEVTVSGTYDRSA